MNNLSQRKIFKYSKCFAESDLEVIQRFAKTISLQCTVLFEPSRNEYFLRLPLPFTQAATLL